MKKDNGIRFTNYLLGLGVGTALASTLTLRAQIQFFVGVVMVVAAILLEFVINKKASRSK